MMFFVLSLVSFLQPVPTQDTQTELKKMVTSMQSSLDAYCLQARKINGTVSTYDLNDAAKKLKHKTVVKADKTRYICSEYNGEQRFINADVYRDFGEMRQALIIECYRKNNEPIMRFEYYAKKGEKNEHFAIEENRFFAYDSPSTVALRPVFQLKLSFLDLLDYPAFKVTSIENMQVDNAKIVKVSFTVDQELNAKQNSDLQLASLQQGWFEFRPDQLWTMHRAEYSLQGDRRRPARQWKTDYVYDPAKNVIPLPKEIKVTNIDQKDKADVKPSGQVYVFDFKIVEGALPDEQFNLSQFELKERTPDEWLKDEAARIKRETESAPTPAGGFPIANSGVGINPWVWLSGGLLVILFLIVASFQFTAKKKKLS